jgi:phage/plasmid-associated DNA primase
MDTTINTIIKECRAPVDSTVLGTLYCEGMGDKQRFAVLPKMLGGYLDKICKFCQDDFEIERDIFIGDHEDIEPPDDPSDFDFTNTGHTICEVTNKRTIPVIINMTFPFTLDIEQRDEPCTHDEGFLIKTAHTIQRVLIHNLNIGSKFSELTVMVEESRVWTIGELSYISINFIFPYCQVDTVYQKSVLYKDISENLSKAKIIKEMNIEPLADWSTIIHVHDDRIPMYRGTLDEKSAPAVLTHIYGPITDADCENGTSLEHELTLSIFNPEHYHYIYSKTISSDFLCKDVPLNHWYPLFRSIYFWPGETIVKEVIRTVENVEDPDEYGDDVASSDPKSMTRYLLPLLSPKRFDIEPFWLDVGQCLYNIFEGEDIGLQVFIQCSSVSKEKGRDKEECTNIYRKMTLNHLTIKTIAWYARKDSESSYKIWHNSWCKNALFEAIGLVHDDVAEALYRIFWLDHIWIDGKRWMIFQNHRLVQQSDAVDLRRDITKKLVPIYKNMRKDFQEMSSNSGTAVDTKQAEVYIKQITNLIEKLGNHTWKMTVIKASQQCFEVKNFDRVKDSDPSKTGWTNCVVVCSGDHAYTVDGKLEDFITKSTFIPCRTDLSWEHPLVKELLNWFYMMFPSKELTHYVLKDIASYLYGRNSEKLLRAWCGDGNNSKTMLAKCIQYAFGLYCIDFPPTFLTGKSLGSSGPNPELAQAHGAHIGFVPETEDDEKVREGTTKRATGGDRQFARNCNENGGPMEMMAKIILMCNKIPEFTSISKALRARFTYVPFLATWSDDAPESIDEQFATRTFKNDPFFEKRLPDLAQALGWIAVQYYPHYKKEGLGAPAIVKEYTERHWEENDPILGFIRERIQTVYLDKDQKIADTSRSLTCTEIYNVYKSWFGQNYPGIQVVTQPIFKGNIEQRIGQPGSHRRWYGIAIIQPATIISGPGQENESKMLAGKQSSTSSTLSMARC